MTTTTHTTRHHHAGPITPATDLERFVWLGVGQPGGGVALDWRVNITQGTDDHATWRLLQLAGPYNAFDPDTAYDLIHHYRHVLSSVELAREASMALYLHLAHWPHQTLEHQRDRLMAPEPGQWLEPQGEPFTPTAMRNAAAALAGDCLDADADEVSYLAHDNHAHQWIHARPVTIPDTHRPHVVRAWWD
jgi:hypothetical protein